MIADTWIVCVCVCLLVSIFKTFSPKFFIRSLIVCINLLCNRKSEWGKRNNFNSIRFSLLLYLCFGLCSNSFPFLWFIQYLLFLHLSVSFIHFIIFMFVLYVYNNNNCTNMFVSFLFCFLLHFFEFPFYFASLDFRICKCVLPLVRAFLRVPIKAPFSIQNQNVFHIKQSIPTNFYKSITSSRVTSLVLSSEF